MNIKRLTYSLAVILAACVIPASAQPQVVDVDLIIKEQRCIEYYRAEGINELEKQGASQLAARLQSYLPFVQFSDGAGAYKLVLTIDSETDIGIYGVNLYMHLQVDSVTRYKMAPYVFRSVDDFYAPLPDDHQGFLEALNGTVDSWLNNEQATIITELFSKISLGKKAYPVKSSKAWALPFSTTSHKIGYASEFEIKSRYTDTAAEWELIYLVKAKGRVLPHICPPEYVGNLMAALTNLADFDKIDDVAVLGIYLTKYVKPGPATQSPDESDL